MKSFVVVLSCIMSLRPGDVYYYHKEETCSFLYSIIKEYHLTVKQENKFKLIVQTSDTRGMTTALNTIQGVIEYKADTVLLRPESDKVIHYPKELRYLSVADSLVILDRDFSFPGTLKKSELALLVPYFIKNSVKQKNK